MPKCNPMPPSPRFFLFAGALTIAVLVTISGCADPQAAGPTASSPAPGTPNPSPTVSVAPDSTPSSTPSATTPAGTAIGKSCGDLVSLQSMYDFDPNFGAIAGYSPKAESSGAAAVTLSGLACGWVQQSSKVTIDLSVAHPGASRLESLKTAAAAGSAEVQGQYFAVKNGVGQLQKFVGPYWITLSSIAFVSAADAQPLMITVASGLG